MSIPKSIGLIDFSHMLIVNFKAGGKSQGPNDAENQTMVQLAGVRSACEHVIVCLDSKPYKRSTVYPEYKAQREREPELVAMWKRCVERLTLDGYQTAKAPGAEADDVIATLAKVYTDDEGCEDVRIYGTDKDCLQCVGPFVRCFSYKGGGEWEIRDEAWVLKRWEVAPSDMALLLAIMGDKSDNIPGIAGIGEKIAAKLINAYKTPAAMAVALAAAVEAEKVTGKLPGFWKNYAQGMAQLPTWIKLTTLDDQVELEQHPLKYLEKLEMKSLVKEPFGGAFGEPSDGDDSGFGPEDFPGTDEPDWERIERETAERERAELAAALSVDPPKPEPRIGKDPNAEKVLADAAAERKAAIERAEKDLAERDRRQEAPESAARIAAGNAAERDRKNLDRHGVERPTHPPKAHSTAGTQVAAAEAPSTSQAATAPSVPSGAPAAAEVVPRSQGPQPEKMSMVVVPPPSWALATQPRSPTEMLKVAADLFNSRLFSQYGSHSGVFAVIALGRELGLGMSQALAGFFIVDQKPFMSSALCRALVQKHPDCDYFMCKGADEKAATWVLRRKSWPQGFESSLTYTWEQAVKAGLTTGKNRHNWETKPVEMLTKTAASKLGKRDFADATFGLDTESEIV